MHSVPPRQLTFHEPQRRAGVSPAPVGNADGTEPLALARSPGRRDPSSVAVLRRVDACPTLGAPRFMVPMQAPRRMEAFHEPERGAPAPPGRRGGEVRARAKLELGAPFSRVQGPNACTTAKGSST